MSSVLSSVKNLSDYFPQISLGHQPPTPPPSSSSPPFDIESPLVSSTPVSRSMLQWKSLAISFCFAAPLEMALLFAQTKSQLSISFHLLSFLVLLTFLFLFVSNFIAHKWVGTAQVLEKIAVLLVATAVVVTVTIPFPLILKCVTWALYAISLIVILIARWISINKEKKTQDIINNTITGPDSTTPPSINPSRNPNPNPFSSLSITPTQTQEIRYYCF
ncbi:hypothetical protein Ddye_014137 [Dipteronia dyeriana]|uniref:Uncharacterized protein n=1 Tax=Dipteronia dyeriana TaxID=168575 RepID=A0AAE0CKB9_9ROSI|nr:hypothetical protein Ddye_014137 [Dipteronia dyeriana]